MFKGLFTTDELNWTEQVDPVTRRAIDHARQRHETDWLQFVNFSSKFELHFELESSSVHLL